MKNDVDTNKSVKVEGVVFGKYSEGSLMHFLELERSKKATQLCAKKHKNSREDLLVEVTTFGW